MTRPPRKPPPLPTAPPSGPPPPPPRGRPGDGAGAVGDVALEPGPAGDVAVAHQVERTGAAAVVDPRLECAGRAARRELVAALVKDHAAAGRGSQIGRASCRERA